MNSLKIPLCGLMCICYMLLAIAQLWSQPFVDPLQVRYTYAFRNNQAQATPFTHFWVGSDVPIELGENTYLLFSPSYEQRQIDSADRKEIFPTTQSFSFPIGLILPIQQSKWSLSFLAVPRWNGEKLFAENTFQFGAVTFASFERTARQKFRIGVYVNDEFFGLYVIPLAGIDWRIDEKNSLFGMLPGRLTYEHQWNKHVYGGFTFRAFTNSYRLDNGQYMRLDDNQLSLYLDYYPAKHVCITLEPGYGLFRKIRTGINDKDYITKVDWGDGPFVKLSAAYRIRL